MDSNFRAAELEEAQTTSISLYPRHQKMLEELEGPLNAVAVAVERKRSRRQIRSMTIQLAIEYAHRVLVKEKAREQWLNG